MEDGCIPHDPVQIVPTRTANQIFGVIPHIVVPNHILHGHGFASIQDIKNILVGKNQLSLVLADTPEDILRRHQIPRRIQVNEHHTGIEILVLGVQTHLIDSVCHLGQPCVRRRRKYLSAQVQLPQRAKRIDDKRIRVEIQHPLQFLWQNQRGEQPIIHLFWITLGGWRIFKQSRINGDWPQYSPGSSTKVCQFRQFFLRDGTMKQIN